MNDVLAEFLAEAEEMLRAYRSSIREVSAKSPSQLRGKLHQAYRAIHTIHGGSGFLALQSLERLSRHGATLVWKLEEEERPPSEDEAALLHRIDEACAEVLKQLRVFGQEGPPPRLLQELGEANTNTEHKRRSRDA